MNAHRQQRILMEGWLMVHTGQNGAIKLGIRRDLDETNIGRQLVAGLDEEDVARHDLVGEDLLLDAIPQDQTVVR